MSKISAWESSDGLIHRDRAVYRKHQAYLDLAMLLRMGIAAVIDSERPDTRDRVLASYLAENRDDIIKLLRVATEAP